jgi:hypothetical protein
MWRRKIVKVKGVTVDYIRQIIKNLTHVENEDPLLSLDRIATLAGFKRFVNQQRPGKGSPMLVKVRRRYRSLVCEDDRGTPEWTADINKSLKAALRTSVLKVGKTSVTLESVAEARRVNERKLKLLRFRDQKRDVRDSTVTTPLFQATDKAPASVRVTPEEGAEPTDAEPVDTEPVDTEPVDTAPKQSAKAPSPADASPKSRSFALDLA